MATETFHAVLGELLITPGLRPLLTEGRTQVTEFAQRSHAGQIVLEKRPHRAGGELRPQGQAAPAAVREGEHLLLDDVRGVADPPRE